MLVCVHEAGFCGVCAEGMVLHDCVEGVVLRGGGGGGLGRGRGGAPHRGAHVFGPQRRQPHRLRRAGLRVQRAPQVQHLSHHTSYTSCSSLLPYPTLHLLSSSTIPPLPLSAYTNIHRACSPYPAAPHYSWIYRLSHASSTHFPSYAVLS